MGTTSVRPITIQDKNHVMHILKNTPEFLPPEVIVAEELIDAFLEEERSSGYHIYVAASRQRLDRRAHARRQEFR